MMGSEPSPQYHDLSPQQPTSAGAPTEQMDMQPPPQPTTVIQMDTCNIPAQCREIQSYHGDQHIPIHIQPSPPGPVQNLTHVSVPIVQRSVPRQQQHVAQQPQHVPQQQHVSQQPQRVPQQQQQVAQQPQHVAQQPQHVAQQQHVPQQQQHVAQQQNVSQQQQHVPQQQQHVAQQQQHVAQQPQHVPQQQQHVAQQPQHVPQQPQHVSQQPQHVAQQQQHVPQQQQHVAQQPQQVSQQQQHVAQQPQHVAQQPQHAPQQQIIQQHGLQRQHVAQQQSQQHSTQHVPQQLQHVARQQPHVAQPPQHQQQSQQHIIQQQQRGPPEQQQQIRGGTPPGIETVNGHHGTTNGHTVFRTTRADPAPQVVLVPGQHGGYIARPTAITLPAGLQRVEDEQKYTAPAVPQPQYILPSAPLGNNVIMIQHGSGGYQLAQLYPLIQAVSPKPPPDIVKSCGPEIVKREHTARVGHHHVAPPPTHCDRVRRPDNHLNHHTPPVSRYPVHHAPHHHAPPEVLEQFDSEVISMILNNTNIDNFNLDSQWNSGLFDNPPNNTPSSNPSPISAHSPAGT
eukprot:sb/3463499/